jgi:hypothetical protein
MNVNVENHAEIRPLATSEQIVEKVLALPDWTPVRLFGILFPLWDVDVVGARGEEQPYPFFERIIERAIVQTGLVSEVMLADFLGLESDLVERVLTSLEAAGRLVRIDGQFHLAPLAVKSVQEGKKYVPARMYLKLYFEGFYSKPLPDTYYDGVKIFSQMEAEDFVEQQRGTGCPFYRLYSFQRWSPLAIKELALREDRTEYHVPADMEQIALLRVTPAYLPLYIVEARKKLIENTPYYMVFSAAQDERDTFLENLVNSYSEIMLPLSGQERLDFTALWEEWQKEQGLTSAHIERLENGPWRATIPAGILRDKASKVSCSDLGKYHIKRGYFLQLAGEDEAPVEPIKEPEQSKDAIEKEEEVDPAPPDEAS